jgi:hypothetical protein
MEKFKNSLLLIIIILIFSFYGIEKGSALNYSWTIGPLTSYSVKEVIISHSQNPDMQQNLL